jgi:ADP-ribosylglycohydrolase
MNLLDRFHGCLAGLALGDALGMPTEMLTPEQIALEFGWVDHPVRAPAWHPHKYLAAGQVTDDTAQALAVAHAYTENGTLTVEAVAAGLLAWAEASVDILPVVVGPSTRRALDRLRAGDDPRRSGRDGTTNGAAYRAIPVGLVNHDREERRREQVVDACLPTHGTGVAISGAAAVASAVATALEAATSVDSILEAAKAGAAWGRRQGTWAWGTRLEKRIDLAARLVAENPDPKKALELLYSYVGVDVLVAESVASAFGVVALARGDPMLAVVYGANLGGDTDTIGALAGAICGAWRGIGAFDRQMLAQIEEVNHLDLGAEAARLEILSNLGSTV